jgi:hypothetical protein
MVPPVELPVDPEEELELCAHKTAESKRIETTGKTALGKEKCRKEKRDKKDRRKKKRGKKKGKIVALFIVINQLVRFYQQPSPRQSTPWYAGTPHYKQSG